MNRKYTTSAKMSQYQVKRDALMNDEKKLRQQYNDYLEEEKQLNTYLMNIPNTEAITKAIEQKKEYRKERDNIVAKKGIVKSHRVGQGAVFIV